MTVADASGVQPGEHGACPVCAKLDGDGGEDRFHHKRDGKWFCRAAHRSGSHRCWGDERDLAAMLGGEAVAIPDGGNGEAREARWMRLAAELALSGDDGLRERAEGLARAVGWLGDE